MDDVLDRATALLGSPEAADLLALAVSGDAGTIPEAFTATLDDLHYRPGAEVTGIFTVSWSTPQGRTSDHLVATTAEVSGPVARLQRDDLALAVWRHPDDPRLPGLAPACDPEVVLGWLADADPALAAPGRLDLELLGYRPLRRAVLRANVDGETLYCKVLRPGYDDALVARQDVVAGAGLTAPVLARPRPGVVWSMAVPGRRLADVIAEGVSVPSGSDLLGLLDRLPAAAAGLPRRASWSRNLDFHAATAARQCPDSADRIGRLVSGIETILAEGRHGPEVPVHGDFYEANILLDGDRLLLVDLDSVGPGLREDDLACCLAHLAVLPALAPQTYHAVPGLLRRWQAGFEATVDARDLRARVAAVLLSLVAGAAPGQDRTRLALAEQWLAAA